MKSIRKLLLPSVVLVVEHTILKTCIYTYSVGTSIQIADASTHTYTHMMDLESHQVHASDSGESASALRDNYERARVREREEPDADITPFYLSTLACTYIKAPSRGLIEAP